MPLKDPEGTERDPKGIPVTPLRDPKGPLTDPKGPLREVDRKFLGQILIFFCVIFVYFQFFFAILGPRDPFQRVDRQKINQKSVNIIKNYVAISQNP